MRHRGFQASLVLVPERPLSDDDSTKDVDAFQEVDERGEQPLLPRAAADR